ncbi:MAG: stalk domain-containing protein [Tissierellia bacterium]|nr:stalk domain-containing protein [Tissierellia bacterium]
MKKFLTFILIGMLLFTPISAFADGEKVYEVPVDVGHYSKEPGKKSMATNAIKHVAKVTEKDGKAVYQLNFKPMEFMNLTGQLTNLFIYDKGPDSSRVEATSKPIQGEYTKEFSFTRNQCKEGEILIAVWVDAMDGLSGGQPGAGEQKAYLIFEWDKAKEVAGGSGVLDQINNKNKPKQPVNKGVNIKVNGKIITPETPAFIENDRTMVPVRFISEALGLKVDWNNAERKVLVGESENLVTLKIDSKEIVKADGTKVEIDSPAIIRQERTFVPLRAIAEISGAKVDWDNETRTAIVEK